MGQVKMQSFDLQTPNGKKKFSYRINITQDGTFTAYLPKEVITLLEEADVNIGVGRGGKIGRYANFTMDGLISEIKKDIAAYESLELIEQKIILKYVIQTRCSYYLDVNGDIVPNGGSDWVKGKEGEYEWKEGTVISHAQQPTPFGLLVYVEPFVKETYKRHDDFEVVKYEMIVFSDYGKRIIKEGQYLNWLHSIAAITEPEDEDVNEIDYTEGAAAFFVDMIIGICKMNEKIKDYLNPESIQFLIKNKAKLIE